MANKAEIRLQIVTALDAAGIKATQQQIDRMANSIAASNRRMGASANETAAALGRMHGPLGKLTGAFGKLGGTMGKVVGIGGMVAGAFETGWSVGSKIWEGIEHVRKEWLGIENEYEKIVKANRREAKAAKEMEALLDREAEQRRELYQLEAERSKEALANIKAEADMWRTAARAKMEYLTAGMDAEYQRLERERFEDVLTLQASGADSAAIQQIEAVYDVLKAELDIKKQMAKVDAEEEKALMHEKELEEKRWALMDKRGAAEKRLSEAEKEMKAAEDWWWFDDAGNAVRGYSERAKEKRMKRARRELAAARSAYAAAQREEDANENELAVTNVDAVNALRRATAMDAANLARDRAAMAYDQAMANGNMIGWEFNEDYANYVRRSTEQSYQALLKIQENTADYDAALNKLLTMRGGD